MERMLLTLMPDAAQQESLNHFVDGQYNPESPYYHQWLTPEQFAERFGVSEADTTQIVGWLQGHGLEVEEGTAGRRSIIFSGTAAQVQAAFHAPIHTYKIGGELHHANAKEPEIPAALVQVVGGVVSLHDFHSEPLHAFARKASPEFTSGSSHYLTPADFATIYNLGPLYQQSINGTGQSIAIVGRSNIKIADVRQFRSMFGLPANDPQIIVNGADPGIFSSGEETEADLDVEWSGAVARNATIQRWRGSLGAIYRQPQPGAGHEHELWSLRSVARFFRKQFSEQPVAASRGARHHRPGFFGRQRRRGLRFRLCLQGH
jgi:subtilase family serine protease